jgi:histidinol dehydrogenase
MKLALQVKAAAAKILNQLDLPIAAQSLAGHGAIIVTESLAAAINLVNRLAPEHLTLFDGSASFLAGTQSAGSIFLGPHSPVAAGDYASGTNHILPTSGVARLRGGLSAADFVKSISVQRLSARGLVGLAKSIITLADTEGLKAHAYSIEARLAKTASSGSPKRKRKKL